MATLTLYDGPSGQALWPAEPDPPGVVVTADDHEAITFALDPVAGRAAVQFVVGPGERRLIAGLRLEEGEGLAEIHEEIRARIEASGVDLVDVEAVPPALAVYHHLGDPNPPVPDLSVQRRVVTATDQLTVGAPTAADAVGVVALVQAQAPEKVVAVQAATDHAGTVDADVVVTLDADLEGVTCLDPATAAEGPTKLDTTPLTDPTDMGATILDPAAAVLRVYDVSSGRLQYDSRQPSDPPAEQSDAAVRYARDGVALFFDRDAGVVRAILQAAGDDSSKRFVVAYHHPDGAGGLLEAFTQELADRVAHLGVEFLVDVDGTRVDCEHLSGGGESGSSSLTKSDWATLRGYDGPLDFAAPGGTAVELATALERRFSSVRSAAVCAAGRPDYLSTTDLVVTPDPDCEAVEPRGDTETYLLERGLHHDLTSMRDGLATVADRVDEVTGTALARQRLFAANLSGGALAERGLTLIPGDDRLVEERRKQAGFLTLSVFLAAGLAYGVLFGSLDQLDPGLYRLDVGPLAGAPVVDVQPSYLVDGSLLVVGGLAAVPLAAYWVFGPRLRLDVPGALLALARLDLARVAACFGDAPLLPAVREHAEALHESLGDVAAAYERLAGHEGSTASEAADFADFLETNLFSGRDVPDVSVVPRSRRWLQLLGGVATGVLAGAVTAAAVLGLLRVAMVHRPQYPPVAVGLLVSLAGIVLLVTVLKAAAVVWRALRRAVHRNGHSSSHS
jgi:hypothetical protein